MQETPYFSIVIPTYNRARFIRAAVESVLAQEEPDFEVIVVDDGSLDHTEQVLRNVEDGRVAYYKKENGERGAARNYGARRSRGRYLNFLDSDDLLYPNHLSAARRVIEEQAGPEVFHLGFEVKDAAGRLLGRFDSLRGDVNERLLRGNLLSCNGVFIRRDVALAQPFNEDRGLSSSEDWELWLRLASRFKIHHSNTVTSIILDHEGRSVRADNVEAALVRRKDLTLRYLSEDEAFVRRYGASHHLIENEFLSYIALHLAVAGQARRAAKYLYDSVCRQPSAIFRRRFLATVKHIIFNSRKSII